MPILQILPLLNTFDDPILTELLLGLFPQHQRLLAFFLGYCQSPKQ